MNCQMFCTGAGRFTKLEYLILNHLRGLVVIYAENGGPAWSEINAVVLRLGGHATDRA
jgi:hypothetical protein